MWEHNITASIKSEGRLLTCGKIWVQATDQIKGKIISIQKRNDEFNFPSTKLIHASIIEVYT